MVSARQKITRRRLDDLYKLAFRYYETHLWKKLWDTNLFAIKFDNGEIGYCCVMGKDGKFNALAVYIGEDGLQGYYRIQSEGESGVHDELDDVSLLAFQDAIMCAFDVKDALLVEAIRDVKTYCTREKRELPEGGGWPYFLRYKPYHLPWKISTQQEADYLGQVLEAALEVAKRLESSSISELGIGEVPRELRIPLLTKTKEGYDWGSMELVVPGAFVYPDAEAIKDSRVKRIKEADSASGWGIACGIYTLPKPTLPESTVGALDLAPQFPLLMIVCEPKSDFICGVTMSMVDGHERDFQIGILKVMEKYGKPEALTVQGDQAAALMRALMKEVGVKMKVVKKVPALRRMARSLVSFMGSRGI